MTNGNRKGKDGERELARVWTALGIPTRRGQQFSGLEGRDVIGPVGVHVECKRVERLNLRTAIEQAKRDASENDVPVVCHRTNNQPWLITVQMSELSLLVERLYLSLCSEGNDVNELFDEGENESETGA